MAEHIVKIENRKSISVSGVKEVIGFDSESVILDTEYGRLTVEGTGLSVCDLSVKSGEIGATGNISSVSYADNTADKAGFFARLFK